jgi:hypothetical protein
MSSPGSVSAPPQVVAVFAALDAAVAAIGELDLDGLAPAVRLRALERLETGLRRQRAISHDVIAGLAGEDPARLGGRPHKVIADRLRISPAEARRRIRSATALRPRTTLTGQPLPPLLPATATAWHHGQLDEQHLRIIEAFMAGLPRATPVATAGQAERFLADKATELRPDQFAKLADRYALLISQDGQYTEHDRARKRGFTWSPQRRDGMSIGHLTATPELRANLDAWLARFAAPGMCNPDDPTPCVAGEPAAESKNTDWRSPAQRNHDALNALVRGQLGDPKLGVHHGLPVAVIASTTLAELTTGAGLAVTAGGTLLPIPDLIRMAAHAYHYLAVFDEQHGRALYLGRTRRTASADQWVVLYARDRGCSRPGCDVPGYHTQAHHNNPWNQGGRTDVDDMTLTCHPDHKLMDNGWRTRRRPDGRTEWIPPPGLELPPGINDYHHPERLLPAQPPDAPPDAPPDNEAGDEAGPA